MLTTVAVDFLDPFIALTIGILSLHITSLSILRYGLGLDGFGFGIVTVGLACLLTATVVSPFADEPVVSKRNEKIQAFTVQHTDESLLHRLLVVAQKTTSPDERGVGGEQLQDSPRFSSLAFVLSQLSAAFRLGIFFLVPFFVLDLLVVCIIGSLGVQGLRHEVVSVPLKIALFVAVDGWGLIVQKLLVGTL